MAYIYPVLPSKFIMKNISPSHMRRNKQVSDINNIILTPNLIFHQII